MTEHANKENQEFDYDGFVLDPRDYEHPGEKAAFNAIKILMPWGKLEEILFKYVQEPIFNAILAGATVKVSQKQFPPIYNIVQRCSSLLDLTPPDIYVVQDPTYNAFTSGIKDPFIVLHSSLVDAYSEEELTFVIAHELGHIKSEHVRYMIIAQGILFKILDILGMRLLGEGLILALLKWMRMAEYTCDRAGYLACGDAVIASEGLAKLALGSQKLFNELNMSEYLAQAKTLDEAKLWTMLVTLRTTHPFGPFRVRELLRFATSPKSKETFAKMRRNK